MMKSGITFSLDRDGRDTRLYCIDIDSITEIRLKRDKNRSRESYYLDLYGLEEDMSIIFSTREEIGSDGKKVFIHNLDVCFLILNRMRGKDILTKAGYFRFIDEILYSIKEGCEDDQNLKDLISQHLREDHLRNV